MISEIGCVFAPGEKSAPNAVENESQRSGAGKFGAGGGTATPTIRPRLRPDNGFDWRRGRLIMPGRERDVARLGRRK